LIQTFTEKGGRACRSRVISPQTRGERVVHTHDDHVSIRKFIVRAAA